MTDPELIARMAGNDRLAFAEFYDRHAARILRLLLRWLGSRADAEDVLQESFWQAWRRASDYDVARATPGIWLVVIARSRALDLRRRRQTPTAGFQCGVSSEGEPWLSLVADERSQQVQQALGQLPKEQRQALCLAFFAGLTHQEVAREQAIPLGTAKTRIKLGIRRLRAILVDESRGNAS